MLGVILAVAVGTAAASEQKTEVYCPLSAKQARLSKVDPDALKSVSRSDVAARANRRFDKADKNNDGKLLRDELPDDKARKAMRRLDKNNDGTIERVEYNKGMLAQFDKRDADRNGVLTSDERGARYSAAPTDTTNDDGDES